MAFNIISGVQVTLFSLSLLHPGSILKDLAKHKFTWLNSSGHSNHFWFANKQLLHELLTWTLTHQLLWVSIKLAFFPVGLPLVDSCLCIFIGQIYLTITRGYIFIHFHTWELFDFSLLLSLVKLLPLPPLNGL